MKLVSDYKNEEIISFRGHAHKWLDMDFVSRIMSDDVLVYMLDQMVLHNPSNQLLIPQLELNRYMPAHILGKTSYSHKLRYLRELFLPFDASGESWETKYRNELKTRSYNLRGYKFLVDRFILNEDTFEMVSSITSDNKDITFKPFGNEFELIVGYGAIRSLLLEAAGCEYLANINEYKLPHTDATQESIARLISQMTKILDNCPLYLEPITLDDIPKRKEQLHNLKREELVIAQLEAIKLIRKYCTSNDFEEAYTVACYFLRIKRYLRNFDYQLSKEAIHEYSLKV